MTALPASLNDTASVEAAYQQMRAEYIRRARGGDFAAWCALNGYFPAAHHLLLIDKLEAVLRGEITRLMIFMPPGSAKALALDTPIPTPTGWKRMGDLKVGDQVFDENGIPCDVTGVSPIWRDRPVYSVKTDCGDEIIADADHEWLVRLCGKRPVFKIKETKELHRRRAKRPMITRAKALDLPHADLPIDPYLLGLWLGNGHSAGMRITSSVEDGAWQREELRRLGVQTSDTSSPMTFGVLGMRARFVELGLIDDPLHNTHGLKYIPQRYLRASAEQRLSLLQGLIDTDGCVCRRRGAVTFSTIRLELALSVRELVRSLGIKAGWSEGRAMLNGKDCGPVYRINFYHARAARLPRKAALCRDQYRTPDTYIDVTPAGIADTVCIQVNSPSHLFLAGRSMTPTHNSTFASVLFPPFFLGIRRRKNIISASYSSRLAHRFGKKCRDLVASDLFREVFGFSISSTAKAADEWESEAAGEYTATSVGGSVTGRRADLALIDDPVKGRQEADSETVRDTAWGWWLSDWRTRLKPGGAFVYIGTRWHEDDPAGRILPEGYDGSSGWITARDGERWYVLSIRAEAEEGDPLGRQPGEMLWPEWFAGDMLAREKKIQGQRNWDALYQQRPKPSDGGILKATYWRYWEGEMPRPSDISYTFLSVDTAYTEKDENDCSACTVWSVLENGFGPTRVLLRSSWEERLEFPALIDLIKDTHEHFKAQTIIVEAKASGLSVIQELRRRLRGGGSDPNRTVREVRPAGDKIARAHAVVPMLEAGAVFVRTKTDRDGELVPVDTARLVINRCAAFPQGKLKDIVDSTTQALKFIRDSGVELFAEDAPPPMPFKTRRVGY